MSSSSLPPLQALVFNDGNTKVDDNVIITVIKSCYSIDTFGSVCFPIRQALIYLWALIYYILGFQQTTGFKALVKTITLIPTINEYEMTVESLLSLINSQIKLFYYRSKIVHQFTDENKIRLRDFFNYQLGMAEWISINLDSNKLSTTYYDIHPNFNNLEVRSQLFVIDNDQPVFYIDNASDSNGATEEMKTPSSTRHSQRLLNGSVYQTTPSSSSSSTSTSSSNTFTTPTSNHPPSTNQTLTPENIATIVSQVMNNINKNNQPKTKQPPPQYYESEEAYEASAYFSDEDIKMPPPLDSYPVKPKPRSKAVDSLAEQFSRANLNEAQMNKITNGCSCKSTNCNPNRCGCSIIGVGCTKNCHCWTKKKCDNKHTTSSHYKK